MATTIDDNNECDLILNLSKLHTTALGDERIRRNLSLTCDDVGEWCGRKILNSNATIKRVGKNWYVSVESYMITVNAYSYTIITAHKSNES